MGEAGVWHRGNNRVRKRGGDCGPRRIKVRAAIGFRAWVIQKIVTLCYKKENKPESVYLSFLFSFGWGAAKVRSIISDITAWGWEQVPGTKCPQAGGHPPGELGTRWGSGEGSGGIAQSGASWKALGGVSVGGRSRRGQHTSESVLVGCLPLKGRERASKEGTPTWCRERREFSEESRRNQPRKSWRTGQKIILLCNSQRYNFSGTINWFMEWIGITHANQDILGPSPVWDGQCERGFGGRQSRFGAAFGHF